MQEIDRKSPLALRTAFRFPLQCAIARQEVLKGALWLLVPVGGWILNMGHRIEMTHRMQHGLAAWPAWVSYPRLLRDGSLTLLGMIQYHSPAAVLGLLAFGFGFLVTSAWFWQVAGFSFAFQFSQSFGLEEFPNRLRLNRDKTHPGSSATLPFRISGCAGVSRRRLPRRPPEISPRRREPPLHPRLSRGLIGFSGAGSPAATRGTMRRVSCR